MIGLSDILKALPDELEYVSHQRDKSTKCRLYVTVRYAGIDFTTRFESIVSGAKPYKNKAFKTPAIYKMFNNDGDLIYIGQSLNITQRMSGHREKSSFADEVVFMQVSWMESETDMHIYEPYLINKLKPKYNKQFVTSDTTKIELPDLKWHDITELWGNC